MKKSVAKSLATILRSDIGYSSSYVLLEEKSSGSLKRFHTFANDRPCLGAFLIENKSNMRLWILLIDWRENGNFYVVIYPERHNSAPLAELHDQRSGKVSTDLIWSYKPSKRDDKNSRRKETFIRAVGSQDFVVSLPGPSVPLDDFLYDIFSLATFRMAADNLEISTLPIKSTGFPEGRRIERIHKYQERDSTVVQQSKTLYAQNNKGYLPCEICAFDFSICYGELGMSYIEAHHMQPLSELGENEVQNTQVEDFAMVCANCHRMLHRKRPWATIDDIRKLIKQEA